MGEGQADHSSEGLSGVYQRAAAAGMGATLGLSLPGPVGLVAGATLGVLLEPLAQKVWGELHGDAQRRLGETLAAAQEAIGTDPEELEQLILSSEESRLQTGIALSAASRSAWPPKIRALGRALAAGLMATDDTRINTQPLIMAALTDIEFPQASLLDLLVRHWPVPVGDSIVAQPYAATPTNPWAVGQRIWDPGDIVLVRPRLQLVLPSLMGTLQRHGLAALSDNNGDPFGRTNETMRRRFIGDLASRQGTWANLETVASYAPAGSWLPTELGQEVLNALLEAGAEFAD